MGTDDRRLDGNAAAGVLSEVFAAEMTVAIETCAHCGATNPIGAAHVYSDAPGVVIRCPACEAILVCIVRTPERTLIDVSGVARLEIPDDA
ncbi:MAG: DUF6510 family protein [Solirubrobacterales bacterium]